jgi:hypothetical protein
VAIRPPGFFDTFAAMARIALDRMNASRLRGARLALVPAMMLGALLCANVGAAREPSRVFYLAVRPHQCLIAHDVPSSKWFLAVPCLDPGHNLEVFAVDHGGWGHRIVTTSFAGTKARSVCLRSYRLLTGHGAPGDVGWAFFFADPGAEAARYGDRVVCSYRAWPNLTPLGRGWHVR